MARQDSFTSDEWTLVRLAPALVSSGVSAADPSGIFSTLKEAGAGAAGIAEALEANSGLELFSSLAADHGLPGMPDPRTMLGEGTREQQMQNFKGAVLERVKSAVDIVAKKASPAEADAYRNMIMGVARKSAEASSEGGFLGFGGVRVSSAEQAFLAEVQKAAGAG
ncbi:MAG TPA: hypothetical protein VMN79_08515 [Casimicrobiaceae bacterium]|nr:hypothetical protein [Casimicrobiaceae bacterium]